METQPEFDLTISNYRCFSREKPATIRVQPGFTSLVGVNNSGKSALLRFFYELRPAFVEILSNWQVAVNASTSGQPLELSLRLGDRDPEELFFSENEGPLAIKIQLQPDPDQTESVCDCLTITVPRSARAMNLSLLWNGESRRTAVRQIVDDKRFYADPSSRIYNLHSMLVALRLMADAVYFPAFRNAVNAGGGKELFDMTVGQNFVEHWDSLKASSVSRSNNRAAIALTKDIEKLLGFDSLEINSTKEGDSLQLVIDGRTMRLDEVGSGISQFILVLASAAHRKPSIVLIDEPEQNLHPSLQLDFLTTLAKYARYGVVFSTHSIGLARSVSDRIYAVTRESARSLVSQYEATPQLSEMLGLLSYSGYAMLGGETVLLVEGPSEVLVFQHFLRLYDKEHKVVILSLGGGEMIRGDRALQLAEIKRICPNVTAIIDSDRSSAEDPPKRNPKEFKDLCETLGISCHLTERAATENYLTDEAVKKAFGKNATALTPWQPMGGANTAWAKNQNWKAAKEMTRDDLDATDLGPILAKL